MPQAEESLPPRQTQAARYPGRPGPREPPVWEPGPSPALPFPDKRPARGGLTLDSESRVLVTWVWSPELSLLNPFFSQKRRIKKIR